MKSTGSDADYLLALIDTAFENVFEIRRHHERMRAIAARLDAMDSATTREVLPPVPNPDLEAIDCELWGQNIKADVWFKTTIEKYGLTCYAAGAASERGKSRALGYELDGVIADVEQGDGFDTICLETIKRVRIALAASTPQAAQQEGEKP